MFIFIAKEGETSAPNGSEAENMQVIGNVENEDEALKKLLQSPGFPMRNYVILNITPFA